MTLHNLAHKAIAYAPDPITGTVGGALGGTLVGTVGTVATLHSAGVTVAGVVASASTIGVGATAGLLATIAGPIVIPAIACCAAYGAIHGSINWIKGGCKLPKW